MINLWKLLNQCFIIYFISSLLFNYFVFCEQLNVINEDFSPSVTAKCDRGIMYINVVTLQPFHGVAHTRDYRRGPCLVEGNGGFNTTLKVSLLADETDEIYCGIHKYKGERSISLAVRAHKSLELSEDKFYFLTCEQSGYKNVRGGTYRVTIKLLDMTGQKVTRVIHGNNYVLRAELTPHDSITSLRLKHCFVFASDTDHVELIDEFGCPAKSSLISQFSYNDSNTAEAMIYEMFKFPDSAKMYIQCDAILCRGGCQEPQCDSQSIKGRDLAIDGYSQLSASTTVYVFEPSDEILTLENLKECTEWRFPWLITLCICLAVLLLLMLLLNMFMCSSLTCRCIKTEIVEKEPSEIEEYDPYKVDWTAPNSHYGSRMSLNKHNFNDSTLKSHKSNHSGYDNDHYMPEHPTHYSTLQHSRPQSRYSTHSLKSQKSQKSQKPPKTIEIDYSNHYNQYNPSRH